MMDAVSFPSVIDDLIDYLNRSGVRAVGSHPGDRKPYTLAWLGGGRQLSKVTAEVIVNFETWVPRDRADADKAAEQLAERVRALTAQRAFTAEDGVTTYRWEWPALPALMPPGDNIDSAAWTRVVFYGQVTVRGNRFHA